jgi:peroxiredoxin Q/BCP
MSKLNIGDQLPYFELENQSGNLIKSSDLIGKPLVIYFYPKDDTPGCTTEACSFRDSYEDFIELGATVLGISSDSVESHKKFSQKYRLPFTLLSDTKSAVRKLFSVPKSFLGLLPGRVTYVFDKEGKLRFMFDSQLNLNGHIKSALSQLKIIVNE